MKRKKWGGRYQYRDWKAGRKERVRSKTTFNNVRQSEFQSPTFFTLTSSCDSEVGAVGEMNPSSSVSFFTSVFTSVFTSFSPFTLFSSFFLSELELKVKCTSCKRTLYKSGNSFQKGNCSNIVETCVHDLNYLEDLCLSDEPCLELELELCFPSLSRCLSLCLSCESEQILNNENMSPTRSPLRHIGYRKK